MVMWAAVGMSAAKGILGGVQRNAQMLEQARQFGVAKANTEYTVSKQLEAGMTSALAVNQNASAAQMNAQMSRNMAEGEADYISGATGRTGSAVDAQKSVLDFNAEWAEAGIEKARQDQIDNIRQTTESAVVQTIGSEPIFEMGNGANPLLRGLLSGLGTYGMLGGFTGND